MKVTLSRVLSWAVKCKWLEENPCSGVPVPKAPTKVHRVILKPEQVVALASTLEEPYATLVLFLAATGSRISEAVGVKTTDFCGDVLQLRRRFYQGYSGGDYGELKSQKSLRDLPLPSWLADRVKALVPKGGFCFHSQADTPINQKNALRRYVHPACADLGFRIAGWHDFRHTLTTWALKHYQPRLCRRCSVTPASKRRSTFTATFCRRISRNLLRIWPGSCCPMLSSSIEVEIPCNLTCSVSSDW